MKYIIHIHLYGCFVLLILYFDHFYVFQKELSYHVLSGSLCYIATTR